MHDTSQVVQRNCIFLQNNDSITARTVNIMDFNMVRKGFKQYLIVGRYLGVALNGLFLL